MKSVLLGLSLFSLIGYAQENMSLNLNVDLQQLDRLAQAYELGLSEADIQMQIKRSKVDVIQQLNIQNPNELELASIEIAKLEDVNLEQSIQTDKCLPCEVKIAGSSDHVESQANDIAKVIGRLNKDNSGPRGVLFLTWGYNRGYHSKSDIKVETPDGTYTIKDAQGFDRPSKLSLEYLKPSKFSIPQYNLKIGYWFSKDSKFGIAAGTDHMKWVFDEKKQYDIEGHFNKPLWVNGQQMDFEQIKAAKNASFMMLEYTDGYNYPYIEGLYREKLIDSARFGLDFVGAAGVGVLFPKERHRIADNPGSPSFRDVDKFHVVGWGAHVEGGFMAKYKFKSGMSVFLNPKLRIVAGKINNARYQGNEGRISHTPIITLQPVYFNLGTEVPLNVISNPAKRKARKQAKKLEEMKKQDANMDELNS